MSFTWQLCGSIRPSSPLHVPANTTWRRHDMESLSVHDDVIRWRHFRVTGLLCWEFIGPRWIPFTQASDAELWFSLICAWTNSCINNRDAGDLRRHRANYDVTVMINGLFPPVTIGFFRKVHYCNDLKVFFVVFEDKLLNKQSSCQSNYIDHGMMSMQWTW